MREVWVCIAAIAAAACATTDDVVDPPSEHQWAATGWLAPRPTGDPEVIGLFATRGECEDALAGWLARQVVGNPIHGECLPIDRR